MADIPDPSFLRCFQNHRLSINWLSFAPNSSYVASASDDKNVMLWSLNDQSNFCYKYPGHSDSVTSVALTNTFMISGSKDCTARLWRLSDRIEGVTHSSDSSIYRCHQSPIRCVDVNSDESQFCTSSDDRTVKIWSTSSTNKYISSLSGQHTNWVRHARFSKLSPYLLSSCGDDGLICIWDVRSKEAAIKLASKRRSTHFLGVQWHPNCEYIISSSSADHSIRIWDLRYEKSVQCYQVHDGFVTSTDFHPSGKYLISSSVDQTCKILDLYEGRTLFTLRAHSGNVNCAQFSPNGEHFATGGQDRALLYWKSNMSSFDELYSTDDEDDVRSISFDPYTPPINSFDSTEIRSIRSKMDSIKIESASGTKTERLTKVNPKIISQSETTPIVKPSANGSSNASPNSSNESLSLDNNCVGILKCILTQLEAITDSILHIDQRLSTLEEKFEDKM